jgi:hypothetical protein
MAAQYKAIRQNALGNFKDMARVMFTDKALRQSLNADFFVPWDTCKDEANPIENYAREFLEIFTVGEGYHNYNDILAMAKALNSRCQREYDRQAIDGKPFLPGPGLIFTDVNAVWKTDTEEHIMELLNHILSAPSVHGAGPSDTARRVCKKLFLHFTFQDLTYEHGAVVQCANDLTSHDWEIKDALESIWSSTVFYENLGQKMRMPNQIIYGSIIDMGMDGVPSNYNKKRKHALTYTGMPDFSPPNVAGYDPRKVWNQLRLSTMHRWLHWLMDIEKITRPIERDDFDDITTFIDKFEDLKVDDYFSYSKYMCGDDYVPEVGHSPDSNKIFQSQLALGESYAYEPDTANKVSMWSFLNAGYDAMRNICVFVA